MLKPIALALLAAVLPMKAHAQETKSSTADEMHPVVVVSTSLGEIEITLDAEHAPVTVNNFLSYVNDGFYTGTIFHRVIPDFMVQGGGYTAQLEKKKTKPPIKCEAGNGLTNKRGSVAMARTNHVNSATCQFFINLVDNDFLDHKDETQRGFGYAVFGHVTKGMDIVDAIAAVKTARKSPQFANIPVEPVVIISVEPKE